MALASAIHDVSADRDLESRYHADGAEPDALLAKLTEFLDTPAPDAGTTKD